MTQDPLPLSAKAVSRKSGVPYWRWLLAPMLLASVGLHGLILLAPTGPSEESLLPPPDPAEDGVVITKIDAPPTRAATPNNAGTVKTAPPAATPTSRTGSAPVPANRSATASRAPSPSARRRPTTNTNAAASGQEATVPNLAGPEPAENPNPNAPPVEGRATNGTGRNTPDRTAIAIASEPDPFTKYVEIFSTYDGVQVSEAEAAETRDLWLQSFSDRGAGFTDLDIQPLKIFEPLPYEAKICLPDTPGAAQVLVLVDAEGNVDPYQPFVQRTGYRAFNNAAEDTVRRHTFPEANTPRAYRVEVAVDYDAADCEWPPKVDRLPDEYFTLLNSYVGPGLTTPRDFDAAQATWLQSLAGAAVDLPPMAELKAEVFEEFEPNVPYPLGICLPIEPKDTAAFGVVVQPDGSLTTEPVPLRSTGYKNFDDRANELVQNFTFPTADAPRVLVVEVPVDYNSTNCQPLDSESFEVPAASTNAGTAASDTPTNTGTAVATNPEPTSPEAIALNPAQQAALLESGRQQVEAAAIGNLNIQLALAAESLETGWPAAIDQSCFLADITTETFVPVETAADALILAEAADWVPATLSRLYQAKVDTAGEYCGAPLTQLSIDGMVQLFASNIPLNDGSTHTLVVLWTADPRENF